MKLNIGDLSQVYYMRGLLSELFFFRSIQSIIEPIAHLFDLMFYFVLFFDRGREISSVNINLFF